MCAANVRPHRYEHVEEMGVAGIAQPGRYSTLMSAATHSYYSIAQIRAEICAQPRLQHT